ncbi:MAG: hypothetical protein LUD72_05655, partial [Bacteroidales bacterium]|nr:hypothetical protein [Bacteroidales bacterium]
PLRLQRQMCIRDRAMCSENGVKSIYYWKTVFKLSDWDKEFLAKHDIKRIYLRLFDVGLGHEFGEEELSSIPMASVRFDSEIPEGIEIVPVVYITQNAIRYSPGFSNKLYERVKKMAKKNGFKDFRELQLDCDWANGTAYEFFNLCEKMRDKLHADGRELSATIRLHQLKKAVPPVDRGVLMIYNTGSLYDRETTNSILNYEDVKAYLKSKVSYGLPLTCAFPLYSWSLLYDKENKFRCILHKTDYSDSTLYKRVGENLYEVMSHHIIEENIAGEGYTIRFERPSFSEINEVKSLALSMLRTEMDGVILYHLDSLEISHYKEEEIDAILK